MMRSRLLSRFQCLDDSLQQQHPLVVAFGSGFMKGDDAILEHADRLIAAEAAALSQSFERLAVVALGLLFVWLDHRPRYRRSILDREPRRLWFRSHAKNFTRQLCCITPDSWYHLTHRASGRFCSAARQVQPFHVRRGWAIRLESCTVQRSVNSRGRAMVAQGAPSPIMQVRILLETLERSSRTLLELDGRQGR